MDGLPNFNYKQQIQNNGTRLLSHHNTTIHTCMTAFNIFVTQIPLLVCKSPTELRLLPHYLPTRGAPVRKNQASSIKAVLFIIHRKHKQAKRLGAKPNDLSRIIYIILRFCTSRTSRSTSCLLFHLAHATFQWQP